MRCNQMSPVTQKIKIKPAKTSLCAKEEKLKKKSETNLHNFLSFRWNYHQC